MHYTPLQQILWKRALRTIDQIRPNMRPKLSLFSLTITTAIMPKPIQITMNYLSVATNQVGLGTLAKVQQLLHSIQRPPAMRNPPSSTSHHCYQLPGSLVNHAWSSSDLTEEMYLFSPIGHEDRMKVRENATGQLTNGYRALQLRALDAVEKTIDFACYIYICVHIGVWQYSWVGDQGGFQTGVFPIWDSPSGFALLLSSWNFPFFGTFPIFGDFRFVLTSLSAQ